MDKAVEVNPHYLDRLMTVADGAGLQATEDIVCGRGNKLVAKGGAIDVAMRERLLRHALSKPLEATTRVIDGVASRPMDQLAGSLLAQHPLLAQLCGRSSAALIEQCFRDLRLTPATDTLLSVYAGQSARALEHAVGVALLAAAMQHQIDPGTPVQPLILAGLLHDVGELYLDPGVFTSGQALSTEQWKAVAAHPVIGAGLLRELPGAGPQVAATVLYHHERLDGFGYPQGLRGARIPLAGQVLAMAEVLMGLVERGGNTGARAAIAVKLIPGEFNRLLLDLVARAARAAGSCESADSLLTPQAPAELLRQAAERGHRLRALDGLKADITPRTAGASAGLRELLAQVFERIARIRQGFCGAGLDAEDAPALHQRVGPLDPATQYEMSCVLREVDWRLRELEREVHRRSERLPPGEAALARSLLAERRPVAQAAG